MVQPSNPLNIAETLRQSILSVLGAPPDPAPLEPTILETISASGLRLEHIKYHVSPNDSGYAYLMWQEGLRMPAPTVILHHPEGNYADGKASVAALGSGNTPAEELAQLGFVVLVPDAIGYGRRRSPLSTGPAYDEQHTYHQGAVLLLRGETLLHKVLWDLSRAVDLLETRPEVDRRHIGIIGQGYGARMALWGMAFEPRLVAGVGHSGIISYRDTLRRGLWFQPEFVVPRLMQVADLHHLLTLIAPRPFLISTVEGDPHTGDAAEIFQRGLPAYQKTGSHYRLSHYHYRTGVGFERHMRFNAYTWLQSWLMPY